MAELAFEHVTKRYEEGIEAVSDMNLAVSDGEFVVMVGPSGCGKSTALRMVAGLEDVTEGDIRIGERVVNRIEPKDRDVAMVFQSYALYPHMSVYDNFAFGLRMQRRPKKDIDRRVREAAGALGLDELLSRRPRQLSGGQRQRVALGRAMVRQPGIFLMDEPLSNLDAQLRVQMRAEILRLRNAVGATFLYVTHDQVEAMTMGDRIVVMKGGVVQQVGSPTEIYHAPCNTFVATFMGSPPMNLLPATLVDALARLTAVGTDIEIRGPWARAAGELGDRTVLVGVRPESLADSRYSDRSLPRLPCKVELVEMLGGEFHVHAIAGTERITASLDGRSNDIRTGDEIEFAIDPSLLYLFDAENGTAVTAPMPERPADRPVANAPAT